MAQPTHSDIQAPGKTFFYKKLPILASKNNDVVNYVTSLADTLMPGISLIIFHFCAEVVLTIPF